MNVSVNLWAVLASAVASMVIGSLWYGPLFGKMFMAAIGMDQWSKEKQDVMKKSMAMSYALQFVASLIMFYVFARFVSGLGQLTLRGALMTALWVWIGFMVPQKLGETVWGGKMVLFWIGISSSLVTILATGAIIGTWH